MRASRAVLDSNKFLGRAGLPFGVGGLVPLGGLRRVLLEDTGLVPLLQVRIAAAGDGGNGGIEHDGHQAAGKAVVVEVHPHVDHTGLEHHGGVEEPGQHAVGPAKDPGDGGQGGAEEAGELKGRMLAACLP